MGLWGLDGWNGELSSLRSLERHPYGDMIERREKHSTLTIAG